MSFRIKVWGPYACFTRPEFKTERVSYDVMTPSAARGIIEAIYWHPGIHYVIDRIYVRSPIRFTNIKRNEIQIIKPLNDIKNAILTDSEVPHVYTSETRMQRQSTVLKDVCYYIDFHFTIDKSVYPNDRNNLSLDMIVKKTNAILSRRLQQGASFHQPCLGCQEFPAYFQPAEDIPECPDELKGTRSFGYMIKDMDYSCMPPQPTMYLSMMRDGCIDIPKEV